MNVLARHWPASLATYGPGDSRLDHTGDEHIEIADYLAAVAVVQTALAELTASTGEHAVDTGGHDRETGEHDREDTP
jgi:LysW-gamma-L-lysine carboxypeptidase